MDDAPATAPAPRGLKQAGIAAAVVAALVVAAGLASRNSAEHTARAASDSESTPVVHLVSPTRAGASSDVELPGTLSAWNTARIFARVPGYVRAWYRDIGAHVAGGTPLGTIDTPELDQQIIQARAALARAQAEASLARSTAARWNDLLASTAVSRQEADEKNGNAVAQQAAVREAQANLGRLLAMKSLAVVRAPFAGTITARNAEIGDLVGPGATSQQPMFAIADTGRIRAYVNVPQAGSAALHAGMGAWLSVPERPGERFPATFSAASGAINPQTGTLQIELIAPNLEGKLRPGGYAQVHLELPGSASLVTIPATTLLMRGKGTEVATVGAGNRVHLLQVTIGRDLGPTVEIASGLTPATPIIDNPPDSIAEGQQVRVAGRHG